MSDEHFTVDGTLIQAWASQKSFRKKDGSGDGNGNNFVQSSELIEVPRREGLAGRAFTIGEMQGYERELIDRRRAVRVIAMCWPRIPCDSRRWSSIRI